MKLFKLSILAMMALTVGLTACDDDSDYGKDFQTGKPSQGAFFPEGLADLQLASVGVKTISIPVYRTDLQAPSSYKITSTVDPDEGVLTIPSEVSFTEGELESVLAIQINTDKAPLGYTCDVKLAINNGTNYGFNKYDFKFKVGEPEITEEVGTGNYILAGWYNGSIPDVDVTRTYSPSAPNAYTYNVLNWFDDVVGRENGPDLHILVPNIKDVQDNQTIVEVPMQYVGEDDRYSPSKVYIADLYHYYLDFKGDAATAAQYYGESTYNVATGLFSLSVVYFLPGVGSFAPAVEYLQLDGFPDYSLDVVYKGMLTDPDGQIFATADLTPGADVASIKSILITDDDIDAAVELIKADAEGVQEISCDGSDSYNVQFPVAESGDYAIVAVAISADGVMQSVGYAKFEMIIGANPDDANWEDAGLCDYIDGWIVAAYGVSAEAYAWQVPVEKSLVTKGTVRLVNPYQQETCPILDMKDRAYNKKRKLVVNVEGENAMFLPQASGYGVADWGGELIIGNYEGLLSDANDGAALSVCVAFLKKNGKDDMITTVEDGIVTIPVPLLGAPGIGDGSFGYNWTNVQASMIALPEASLQAKHKARAASVAAPQISGLNAMINVSSIAKDSKKRHIVSNWTKMPKPVKARRKL